MHVNMNERIKRLEDNLAELLLFKKKHKLEEVKKDSVIGWAL
jgi:hypothetical protein